MQVVDAMVIAAGERGFTLPDTMTIECRVKARWPFHHWSHENQPGHAIVKTPARRTINGFALYDQVRVTAGPHRGAVGYITGLRTSGHFAISHLEGDHIADVSATRLHRIAPMFRHHWIETRPILQAILKEIRPAPTGQALLDQTIAHARWLSQHRSPAKA